MEAEGLGVGEAGTEQESCLKSSHCLGCNVKAHIPHSASPPPSKVPFFFFFFTSAEYVLHATKKKKNCDFLGSRPSRQPA